MNGLWISDGYVIPTIPDYLSTYGIPQIIKRVRSFAARACDSGRAPRPIGIVATKMRVQSEAHLRVMSELEEATDAPLFRTVFKEHAPAADAAEYKPTRTLRQKWKALAPAFQGFADELAERLNVGEGEA